MKLTRLERYMIANQLRILEALYPEDAEHYANNREAFERGYERHYDWALEHIDERTMSEEASAEVTDILDMFNEMQYAYDELGDKSGLEPHRITFSGFDGNTEGDALGYARYFCERTGHDPRFVHIKRNSEKWNSHMPIIPWYRAMLVEWHKSANPHALTKDDMLRITAVKYPEWSVTAAAEEGI